MRNGDGLPMDVVRGAVAGLAATWVMGLVTAYLYEHEDETARGREDAARGGRTAYDVAAGKLADVTGARLSDDERQKLGSLMHWLLGAGAGAAYGALRNRVPSADAGHGLAFGAAFWGVVDEGANPALGLTPGPRRFPWQTHARGLVGHLVFGVVAETVLGLSDRLTA